MESAVLGLVLDSSVAITAERKNFRVLQLIEAILDVYGDVEISLSPVTVAELVHGVYRARTTEVQERRRQYVEELVNLLPVHPATAGTAWIAGQIDGQESAKGNVIPSATFSLPPPRWNKAMPF